MWSAIAGVLYLVTIVTGVFAEVFVRGALIVRDDAAATGANILAHELLYRAGLVSDLLMLASYVAVTALFYPLFKPVGKTLSQAAALFSLVGICVLAVNSLTHVAPLMVLGTNRYLADFTATQLQSASLLALKVHGAGYQISGVFFGIYCVIIGDLIYRSLFLPRLLGVVMITGGLSYVAWSLVTFLFPHLATSLPDLTILGGLAELSLSLWLIAVGIDGRKWGARASEFGPLPA